MSCISNDHNLSICFLTTSDISELVSVFYTNVQISDIIVHVKTGDNEILKVIAAFISSGSTVRVIVIVENVYASTVKLLRAIGVTIILSKFDSLDSIREVLNTPKNIRYMSPKVKSMIKSEQRDSQLVKVWDISKDEENLTPTETDIILDLCQGMSPWVVAKKRFISIKTVSRHKINALKKMGLKNINAIFITCTNKEKF